jgi:integrase
LLVRLSGGLAKRSIEKLEWSDVHDGNVYLRSVHSKNRRGYFVPITGEFTSLIARREAARAVKKDSGVLLAHFVFHRNGDRIQEFRKNWQSACLRAGLGVMVCTKCGAEGEQKRCAHCKKTCTYKGRIFHDLHRSAARSLIRSGVSKDVAKQLGGWKTDAMFSRYNVTCEQDLREAMEKLVRYYDAESKKVVVMEASG